MGLFYRDKINTSHPSNLLLRLLHPPPPGGRSLVWESKLPPHHFSLDITFNMRRCGSLARRFDVKAKVVRTLRLGGGESCFASVAGVRRSQHSIGMECSFLVQGPALRRKPPSYPHLKTTSDPRHAPSFFAPPPDPLSSASAAISQISGDESLPLLRRIKRGEGLEEDGCALGRSCVKR